MVELNINRFYVGTVYATRLTGVSVVFIDEGTIAGRVKEESLPIKTIKIMLGDNHRLNQIKFPKEIMDFLSLFIMLLALMVFSVSLHTSKTP